MKLVTKNKEELEKEFMNFLCGSNLLVNEEHTNQQVIDILFLLVVLIHLGRV